MADRDITGGGIRHRSISNKRMQKTSTCNNPFCSLWWIGAHYGAEVACYSFNSSLNQTELWDLLQCNSLVPCRSLRFFSFFYYGVTYSTKFWSYLTIQLQKKEHLRIQTHLYRLQVCFLYVKSQGWLHVETVKSLLAAS